MKHSSQENTYSGKFSAEKAVDGNLSTYSKVEEKSNAIWWRVQMDRYHNINKISITMDTGKRLCPARD